MKAISRSAWFALVAAGAVYVASFSLVAHSPPVGPQGAMPPAASPQAATPPAVDPDAGRGRQGGRGGRGGPNETDPANAEADFTRQAPVLPLSPAEQATHSSSSRATGWSWSCPNRTSRSRRRSRSTATAGCSCSKTAPTCRTRTPAASATGGRISRAGGRRTTTASTRSTPSSSTSWCSRASSTPFGAEQHPDDGDRRRRSLEVHRHEQRRRRRQEGAVRHRLRPVRQRRAPAGVPDLGDGQLAVQHRATRSACAGRRTASIREPTGSNGAQWGVTQDNDGKIWFQGGASGMPGVFPVPGRLRQLQRARSNSSRTSRFRGARRSASRTCRAACRRVRMPDGTLNRVDRRGRQRRLPRPSAAGGSRRRLLLRRAGRRASSAASRPVVTEGLTQLRNVVPLERVHQVDRPALPSGGHGDGAGRDDVHRRHVPRHHPGGAVDPAGHVPARAGSISTSSTRSTATAASGG